MEQPKPDRRAPYAPVGALHGFLASIKNGKPPPRIDVAYLRGHALARGNEWAFISALKFLGIVDYRGRPTTIFRKLQGAPDTTRDALASLVRTAYAPLFEAGGDAMTKAALRSWLADNSSASQAANATRFFLEVCHAAGIETGRTASIGTAESPTSGAGTPGALSRKAKPIAVAAADLVSKVPSYDRWKGTPAEYLRVLEAFEKLAEKL